MTRDRRVNGGFWCVACCVLCAGALLGCDKAKEAIKEKAMGAVTEKIVESAIEKEGGKNVKADLDKDHTKLSLTDKSGKQVSMETGGGVTFTEEEFGVPFYPSAQIDNKKSVKIVAGPSYQYSATFESHDPFDKVSGFYRDKLKALAGKRQFMEAQKGDKDVKFMIMGGDGGGMLAADIRGEAEGAIRINLVATGKKKEDAPAPGAPQPSEPSAKPPAE